jgi:alkylation response protein AidB-like acyl-CoA dehydrogenase
MNVMDTADTEAAQARALLADGLDSFMAQHPGPARIRRVRESGSGIDPAFWKAAAEAGWFGLRVPEPLGGSGLGLAELAVMMHALGRNLAPEPVAACVVLAGGVLARCPATPLRDRLLTAMIAGGLRPAFAWQEAPDVHDPAAVVTMSREGRLTGCKQVVHGAAGADGFVVTAQDGLYWVAAAQSGLSLDAMVDGTYLGRLALHDAAAERLAEGDVAALVEIALDEARLAVAAELIGIMDYALTTILEYLRTRKQFGVAIGSFQVLQHRAVDLWIQYRLAKAVLNRAIAVFHGTPRDRVLAVSAAKARASDAALLIGRQGIQLHGGMGYTDACDIGLCLKRALTLSAFLGNAQQQRRRFASHKAAA